MWRGCIHLTSEGPPPTWRPKGEKSYDVIVENDLKAA